MRKKLCFLLSIILCFSCLCLTSCQKEITPLTAQEQEYILTVFRDQLYPKSKTESISVMNYLGVYEDCRILRVGGYPFPYPWTEKITTEKGTIELPYTDYYCIRALKDGKIYLLQEACDNKLLSIKSMRQIQKQWNKVKDQPYENVKKQIVPIDDGIDHEIPLTREQKVGIVNAYYDMLYSEGYTIEKTNRSSLIYYGTYEGYPVLIYEGNLTKVEDYHMVPEGVHIYYHCVFQMYLYKDGELKQWREEYLKGNFSLQALANVSEQMKEMRRDIVIIDD